MATAALIVSFMAIAISCVAIHYVTKRDDISRERTLRELGDPTNFTVVTDGKDFRVRGPFDTFYTMRCHSRADAEKFKEQLAAWYHNAFHEGKWWKEAA